MGSILKEGDISNTINLFITLFRITGYKNWFTQVFYLGFPCELIDTRVEKNLPQRVPVPQNCSCSLIFLEFISQK